MKTKLIRSILLGFAALGTLALVSCQVPAHTPSSALNCNKCGTVYFKSPSLSAASPGGKGFVTLRPASSMSCPDCENQVIAWVKTGAFTRHVCKSCGGTLHHCTNH